MQVRVRENEEAARAIEPRVDAAHEGEREPARLEGERVQAEEQALRDGDRPEEPEPSHAVSLAAPSGGGRDGRAGILVCTRGLLAQLVRACGSHPQGRWFEPSTAHRCALATAEVVATTTQPFGPRTASSAGL